VGEGVSFGFKKWKFRGVGRGLCEISTMGGGMDISWNYTMLRRNQTMHTQHMDFVIGQLVIIWTLNYWAP